MATKSSDPSFHNGTTSTSDIFITLTKKKVTILIASLAFMLIYNISILIVHATDSTYFESNATLLLPTVPAHLRTTHSEISLIQSQLIALCKIAFSNHIHIAHKELKKNELTTNSVDPTIRFAEKNSLLIITCNSTTPDDAQRFTSEAIINGFEKINNFINQENERAQKVQQEIIQSIDVLHDRHLEDTTDVDANTKALQAILLSAPNFDTPDSSTQDDIDLLYSKINDKKRNLNRIDLKISALKSSYTHIQEKLDDFKCTPIPTLLTEPSQGQPVPPNTKWTLSFLIGICLSSGAIILLYSNYLAENKPR